MNRAEFMAALERGLRELPQEEINNAVSYYTEYFDDAGPEHEEKVIAELGSPVEIAAQLVATSPTLVMQGNKRKSPASGCLNALKTVAVTIPLRVLRFCWRLLVRGIGLILLTAAALLLLFLFLCGIVAVGAGIVLTVMGLMILIGLSDGYTAMLVVGVGFVGLGAGTSLTVGGIWSIKRVIAALRRRAQKKQRGDVEHENEN